ncbi:hypothetical protein, partial [Sphingomonas pituitosa]|uniref:hypothetical protein n=1 Tax=Sphingomonas pituitosa TaxID=99597 RepID=UPI000A5F3037
HYVELLSAQNESPPTRGRGSKLAKQPEMGDILESPRYDARAGIGRACASRLSLSRKHPTRAVTFMIDVERGKMFP